MAMITSGFTSANCSKVGFVIALKTIYTPGNGLLVAPKTRGHKNGGGG